MSLTGIILLILLGILLLLIEFFLVPGVTVAGIGGFLLIGLGIFLAYKFHSNTKGTYVLIGTFVFTILILFISFQSGTWKRLSLDDNITGKMESFEKDSIKKGDEGETITRLAPMGKVRVNDNIVEAKSTGGFISEHTNIIVTKVLNTNIIVKPKNS
jgi:membrane-bound ClpP family serine protease